MNLGLVSMLISHNNKSVVKCQGQEISMNECNLEGEGKAIHYVGHGNSHLVRGCITACTSAGFFANI